MFYSDYDSDLEELNIFMKKMRSKKNQGVLNAIAEDDPGVNLVKPQGKNVTRWSGSYKMLKSYTP